MTLKLQALLERSRIEKAELRGLEQQRVVLLHDIAKLTFGTHSRWAVGKIRV
jgi:hypothetical protein